MIPDDELRQRLNELNDELEHVSPGSERAQGDIRRETQEMIRLYLDQDAPEDHNSLREQLEGAIEQLEVEHPQLMNNVRAIIQILSNAGL